MGFDAKAGILKAINETNDPSLKTVLLLLLGVFEEIADKIDNVLTNEDALRSTVLNGYEPVHHEHHKWIADRITKDEDVKTKMSWINVKMAEEERNKETKRKATDTMVIELVKIATVSIGSIAAAKFFGF